MEPSFRELMDLWDENSLKDRLSSVLDNTGLVLFLVRNDELFGCPEDSRLTFARLKNPDPGDDIKDAMFSVFDLKSAMLGKQIQKLFGAKDLDSLKIIDREEAEKRLSKK